MSNIVELRDAHKRYERAREGARENGEKERERSGLGGMGMVFREG